MSAENPTVEAEVVAEPEIVEEKTGEEAVESKYISGEIRIIADGKTGAISVVHPENMITAMGMIEMAKVVMVDNLKQSMSAPRRPTIVPAGAEALKHLGKPH